MVPKEKVGCVIGQTMRIGDNQKVQTKSSYILRPLIDKGVFFWGVDITSDYGQMMANYLIRLKGNNLGYNREVRVIACIPSDEWIEECYNKEAIRELLKKCDKIVRVPGTEKDRWQHLIGSSTHLLTYLSDPANIVKEAIIMAFDQNLDVSNSSSLPILMYKKMSSEKKKNSEVPFI